MSRTKGAGRTDGRTDGDNEGRTSGRTDGRPGFKPIVRPRGQMGTDKLRAPDKMRKMNFNRHCLLYFFTESYV